MGLELRREQIPLRGGAASDVAHRGCRGSSCNRLGRGRINVIHQFPRPRYAIRMKRCRCRLPRTLFDCMGWLGGEAQLHQFLVFGPYVVQALLLILANGNLRGRRMVAVGRRAGGSLRAAIDRRTGPLNGCGLWGDASVATPLRRQRRLDTNRIARLRPCTDARDVRGAWPCSSPPGPYGSTQNWEKSSRLNHKREIDG